MSAKQRRAFTKAEQSAVSIFEGAVRAGKTFSWLMLIIEGTIKAGPRGGIVVVGKNRDSIYRNVFEPIETEPTFAYLRPHIHYRQNAPNAHMFGRTVHIVGANDESSESRIRGMTLQKAYCDEITVLNKTFFKQLHARLSVPGAQLFGTTNPDSPGHWLKSEYLNRVPGTPHFDPATKPEDLLHDWYVEHFTMDDNPSLDDEYRSRIKRLYSGLWYDRFVRGLWVAAEGAIFGMWDHNTMIVKHDEMPPMRRLHALGIDYGTTNPTAGVLLGEGDDGRLYVVNEWAPTRSLPDGKLADSLTEWSTANGYADFTFIDPSARSFREELHGRDWPGLGTGSNKVLDGIRTVASVMSQDKLRVSDRCTNLLKELPGYRWDDKASTKGEDRPIKQDDHFCDALRYAIYTSRRDWMHLMERPLI
jgi:PBSX family phage terminase large subunit